ncbi:hypothetical protein ACJJTC_005493 [Scirpophaga incertulas]
MASRVLLGLLSVTVAFSHIVVAQTTLKVETTPPTLPSTSVKSSSVQPSSVQPSTAAPVTEPAVKDRPIPDHSKDLQIDGKRNRRVMWVKASNANDEALKCHYSDLLSKLIDIILEFIKESPLSNIVKVSLSVIRNYLQQAPPNAEKPELYVKFKEVEAMVLRENYIKENLFQLGGSKHNGRTIVTFNQRLPRTDQLECQGLFTNLIKEAYDKYAEKSLFPKCTVNNYIPTVSMSSLPFTINFDDTSPLISNNGIQQNNLVDMNTGVTPLQNYQTVKYLQNYKYFYPPQAYYQPFVSVLRKENVTPNSQVLPNDLTPKLETYPSQTDSQFGILDQTKQADGNVPALQNEWANRNQLITPGKYNNLRLVDDQSVNNLNYIPHDIQGTYTNAAPNDYNFFRKPTGDLDKSGNTQNNIDNLFNPLGSSMPAISPTNLAADLPAKFTEQTVNINSLPAFKPEQLLYGINKNPTIYNSANGMRTQNIQYLPVQGTDSNMFNLNKLLMLNNHPNAFTNEPQGPNLGVFNIPNQYDYGMVNLNVPSNMQYIIPPKESLNGIQTPDYQGNYGQLINGAISTSDLKRSSPMSNLVGLPTAPNKLGIIELTYVLKRPEPILFQPVYYVKYRIPYSTFLKEYKELLNTSAIQRSDSLHGKLLTNLDIAGASPDLSSYGKEDILNLVRSTGKLVDAKLVTDIPTNNGNKDTHDIVTPPSKETTLLNDNGLIGIMPIVDKTPMDKINNPLQNNDVGTTKTAIQYRLR